jgi:hypothetical protein
VFTRVADGALWSREGMLPLAPTGSWRSLGGRLTSGVTASNGGRGFKMNVFALGTDNQIWPRSGIGGLGTRTRPYTGTLTRAQVAAIGRLDAPLRDKGLWWMLYETAARAEEILDADVPDLDLPGKRGHVASKGETTDWVHWRTGTALLLPRLLAGRQAGPVFLASRKPARAVATIDLCPVIGRARLCYRRAAESFELATRPLASPGASRDELDGSRGWTLHQLRHSMLTHQFRGRHQHPDAARPVPARFGPFPRAVRPAWTRGCRPPRRPHRPRRPQAPARPLIVVFKSIMTSMYPMVMPMAILSQAASRGASAGRTDGRPVAAPLAAAVAGARGEEASRSTAHTT